MIGGSVALGLETLAPGIVKVYDKDGSQRKAAADASILVAKSASEAVKDADLVVLAMSPADIAAQFEKWAKAGGEPLQKGAIVTEVASVKGSVYPAARKLADSGRVDVILSHPLAGSEKNGFAAADAKLFTGAAVVLTPVSANCRSSLAVLSAIWHSLGTRNPTMLSWLGHDKMLASSSHLPHIGAYALARTVGSTDNVDVAADLSGGGLRDSTRVAASDPALWADITLTNAEQILPGLSDMIGYLEDLRTALHTGDKAAVSDWFAAANAAHKRLASCMEAGQSPAQPNRPEQGDPEQSQPKQSQPKQSSAQRRGAQRSRSQNEKNAAAKGPNTKPKTGKPGAAKGKGSKPNV